MSETCQTCRYWLPAGQEYNRPYGKCRAMPPTLSRTRDSYGDDMDWRAFPQTPSTDWCGMYANGKPPKTEDVF
jgi:hypothetical protein